MEDNNDRPQSEQPAPPNQQESSELSDRAVTNSAVPTTQINQNIKGDYNQTIGQMLGGTAIGSVTGNVTIQSERPRFLSEHQLPPDITDFTGRTEELERVLAELQKDSQRNTVAISGMAGAGKSALAIRAAHRLQAEFDQVQLYVNLRGAEDHQAIEPANVLVEWLRALGLDDAQIPVSLEDRTRAYRSLLQGKRAIVLLDNAQDEAQVRPLLPASPTCAVLITSRPKLVALSGTTWLELPILPEDEALNLLKTLIGSDRVEAEPDQAQAILALCGQLPLAIRIAARTLNKSSQQRKSLADYAHKLRDERQRLAQLHLDHLEENLDVRSSFNLSYRALSDELAGLFRWLGLLDVPDFGVGVTAVLSQTDKETAQQQIEQLIDAQLLQVLSEERYRFHDLIRLFAREQLEQVESPQQQSATRQRVIQHCLEWAYFMDDCLHPPRRREIADSLIADHPTWLREQTERGLELRALAWFEQERSLLLSLTNWISEAQTWEQLPRLSGNLALFLDRHAYWLDAEQLHLQALNATRLLGDCFWEGALLNNLGLAYQSQGMWSKAIDCFEQSLQIQQAIGNTHGEGLSLNNLGNVYCSQGMWSEAIDCFERSLSKRPVGDAQGEGALLNNLGLAYQSQGMWSKAIDCFEQSLNIFQAIGDIQGEGASLNNLGIVYSSQGMWSKAIGCFEQPLQIKQLLNDIQGEGASLNNLGIVYSSQGMWSKAIDYFKQSLNIFRIIGDVHGEGLSLMGLGKVHIAQARWDEAKPLWQEALTKLHPNSPKAKCLAKWLQALDRPPDRSSDRPHQPTLFRRLAPWLLLLAAALFLLSNLLAGRWLVALAIVLVTGIAWLWLKAVRNRN